MHQKKGCKDIYLIINETDKKEQTNCELKWSKALSINNEDIWSTVYKICFKSISDNALVWFQYRRLYNILNTNDKRKHLLMDQKKGCKDIYLIINEIYKKEQTNCELKWSKALSINNEDIWPTVYKIYFKSISDNALVWFQYRRLYNILNTNDKRKQDV